MKKYKVVVVCFVIYLFIQCLPFIWILFTSIRQEKGLLTLSNYNLLKDFSLLNYGKVFSEYNFVLWMRNSIIVSFFAALIATLGGWYYSINIHFYVPSFLSKIRALVFISYLIPSMFLILAIQQIFSNISGWYSVILLIICYQVFLFPVSLWISGSYTVQIPRAIIGMSCMDRLSFLERLKYLIFPYAKKGIAAVFSLCFIMAFQEYLYGLIFIKEKKLFTIPLGITRMQAGDIYKWGVLAAASFLVAAFLLILVLLIRDSIGSAVRHILITKEK